MKKNTKKVLGILAISMLLVTGCGKVPKLENGQDAVITLKGENISIDTLYKEMKDRYALMVLLDLMDEKILNQKYEDTDDIKKTVDSQMKLMVAQYGQGSEAKLLQQTYEIWGIDNMDDLRDFLKLQQKKSLAMEDYAKNSVTEEEIQKFYDETIFGDMTVRHILIEPDVASDATDAEKTTAEEEALKTANEVISKLKNGEKFEDLAKEYSDDETNKEDGGLLPKFSHGDYEEEFEKASKELEVGKYTTTPVKTSYGYHIIYKEAQDEKPELKIVEDDIREELGENKLNDDPTIQVTALEELRKEFELEIHDDRLKKQYETYLKNLKEQLKENE